ncbi:MAG: DUF5685 family protein [Lachnospiraceae bacterium]|nr:DUF5685 family protein [Lachnospiraceae bacterium]
MFGYIVVDQPELKFKEFAVYRSYYCGLCKCLKREHGPSGQLSLSNDMTFVIMLLTALYEPKETEKTVRCIPHPFEKHPARTNEYTEYAADMNVLLTYYKCMDDWKDEKKASRYLYGNVLKGSVKKIEEKYPEKAAYIKERLKAIEEYENKNEPLIDLPSGAFGDIMAEILCYRHDAWEKDLRELGFYLGKFIYIMDAYEDMEKDEKSGNYNPINTRNRIIEGKSGEAKDDVIQDFKDKNNDGYDDDLIASTESMLAMMMGECAKAFERLPIIKDVTILRNILYSGVWCKYNQIQSKDKKVTDKHEQSI